MDNVQQLRAGCEILMSADLARVFWARDEEAAANIAKVVFEAMEVAAPKPKMSGERDGPVQDVHLIERKPRLTQKQLYDMDFEACIGLAKEYFNEAENQKDDAARSRLIAFAEYQLAHAISYASRSDPRPCSSFGMRYFNGILT